MPPQEWAEDHRRHGHHPHPAPTAEHPGTRGLRVRRPVAHPDARTGLPAALETGRCSVAGYLPEFERQATSWEAEQHQPDRVAVAVVAFDVLSRSIGQQMHIVPMADISRRVRVGKAPPPAWMRRRIGDR